MANLREFRKGVSVLKKQGLISGTTQSGTKIDARSALPSWKVNGKRLDTLVKKYDDVVTGKATAVSVPAKSLPKFRKSGFETAKGKVIVPHSKQETARFQQGSVAIKNKNGIERIQIPVEFHNLRQYLQDLKKNAKLINRMKRNNEYFGIRFFGGQRANFYSDIEGLIADLERYEDIQKHSPRSKQAEIYQNLEIIKMTRPAAERVEDELHERKRVMTKEYNRRHAKRVYARMKQKGETHMKNYRARKAERQREYRQRLKSQHPQKYRKQLNGNAERAAKSHKKIMTKLNKKAKKKTTKKRRRS